MVKITKLTFQPLKHAGKPLNIPAKVEINFDSNVIEYRYNPDTPEIKYSTTNFELPNLVKGKLWALDRQTSDCYFTLYPCRPLPEKSELEINIELQGPAYCWTLSID